MPGEWAAARGDEHRVALRTSRKPGSARREIASEPIHRLFAQRHEPLLAALAENAHDTHVEAHLSEFEADEFRHAQSCGIERFQHRAVAQAERRVAIRCIEERFDLFFGKALRQGARELRRANAERRVADNRALRRLQPVEASQ